MKFLENGSRPQPPTSPREEDIEVMSHSFARDKRGVDTLLQKIREEDIEVMSHYPIEVMRSCHTILYPPPRKR